MIEAELNQATAQGQSTQTSTADPKSDPDYGACEKTAGDFSITACDRAIASGKFAGADLGALYRYRGYTKSNAEKPDLDAALADYGEAVRLEPNSFIPFALRAIVYAGKGEQELAIKDYDRAIELNPRADFYNNRGNALRQTRAFDRAIADLDQAIKLEPNYSSAYWTRGLIYRDKGDKEKAAEDYKKALSLNPSEDAKKEIEALLKEVSSESASQPATSSEATPPQQAETGNSGTATDDTGKEPEPAPSSKVLKSTEEVLADPDFKACQAMGTNQAADCDRAIASGKFEGAGLAVLYNNRGQAQGVEHDDAGAFEDFNKSIELNPDGAVAYNNRGVIYSNRKEYDRAIADFDKSIELNATKPFPFQSRGLAYWKKGDLNRAAEDYKKALSLNPPPKLKEQIEQELKEIEAGVKEPTESAPAQKESGAAATTDTGKDKEPEPAPGSKVLKSTEEMLADPDFKACRSMGTNQAADCDRAIASGKFEGFALATLYNNRGQARGMNKDDDRALEDFNKAIELNPNAGAPFNNRGTIFSERGEYDRAIADFDKAVELNATQPIIFHGRGLAYWRKGDLEHAAQDYKKALSLNPPGKMKEIYEQELKEIEAGAKSAPNSAPAQKQGSGATPPDDKNSALSGVREGGGSDAASGLPSTTEPTEGQGSSLSLLPKEDQGGAGIDTGRPSGTRLPEWQGSALPALPGGVATTPRPGVYRMSGMNGRGDSFAGIAALTKDRDKFRLTVWNGPRVYRGTGQFADGILKMKYTDGFRVAFRLEGDGSLDGKGAKGGGSERFEPFAFTATTDIPLAEGVYRVAGRQPDGKPTSGAVKITKQGTGFHLEWTYGDGDKFEGRGNLADNILVLKGSENGWDKDAVIAYALASDGVLAGLYANGTGQEKLTPEGWKPSPSADATPQDDKPGPGSASQASADQPTQTQGSAMKAQPTSGPWAAIAADGNGGWGSAVGQPSQDEARNAALKDCGGSACKILDALQSRCIAYVESRQGGYWYFDWIGPNESNVQNNALNACNKKAPAGSCKIVKSICAPGSATQASADPKKDAESCMDTFGRDTIPACDRAIASGKFGNLDLGTLHNKRGVVHYQYKETEAALADLSEAIGSTAATPITSATAATLTACRAITTRPSTTSARPSGSLRTYSRATITAPRHI